MTDLYPVRRALLSVSDKTGLVEFAKALAAYDIELISTGGYYHSLPQDPLRQFIDSAAEVQRAMGFENEKDHPEVGPSQFEMNFKYSPALIAADRIQLYKLLCRQVAQGMGMSCSFLPKPITGINGSGMHTNISLERDGENLFYDEDGENHMSEAGQSLSLIHI